MESVKRLCSFLLVFISGASAGIEQCPGNVRNSRYIRQFGSSCYEFVLSHPVDWSHANQDCILKGGSLVDIHSSGENYFIYKTLRELGYLNDEGVWIGLTDVEKENNWHWTSSGSSLNYKNWAPGQPGILGTFEDCVLLQVQDGKWHDFPCSGFLFSTQRHGWVCEYGVSFQYQTSSKPLIGSTFYSKLTTRSVDSMTIVTDNGGMMTGDSGPVYTEQPFSGNGNGGMATDMQMMTSDNSMTSQLMATDSNSQ